MIISAERAISHASQLLQSSGVNQNAADRTARCIVTSDVWGNPSHGLMRLPFYLQRISMGGVNAGATLRTLSQRGAVTSLDGEDGLGHWQLWDAAELAVTKAKEFGISLVSVKNSSHCGALGVYVYPGTDSGQIALIFTNGQIGRAHV